MKTRPALALAALAVGVAGAAAPALASSPRSACPAAASGTAATVEGVVTKAETPAANPSPKPATATASSATATATTRPAKAATLEIKVVKVVNPKASTRSMKGRTYTVVDCSGQGATAKRKDAVKVVSFRVKGDSHRLYASSITVTKAAARPAPKPTASKPAHH